MNTSWRLIRAQARNDGTLHTCWHCGRSIAHGSLCMTRDEKRPDRSLVRLYAHDGCHNTKGFVDVFDGRRAWSKTHLGEQPLNKAEAHRLAHKLRDPKFYTARTKRAVNSGGAL